MFIWILPVDNIFTLPARSDPFAISTQRLDHLAGTVCQFQRPASLSEFSFGLLQRQIGLAGLPAPDPRELKAPNSRRPKIPPALCSGATSGHRSVPLRQSPLRSQRTAQAMRRTAQAMARGWSLLGGTLPCCPSPRDTPHGAGPAEANSSAASWLGSSTSCSAAFSE